MISPFYFHIISAVFITDIVLSVNTKLLLLAGLWVWSPALWRTIICLWCKWMEFCEKFLQVMVNIFFWSILVSLMFAQPVVCCLQFSLKSYLSTCGKSPFFWKTENSRNTLTDCKMKITFLDKCFLFLLFRNYWQLFKYSQP